MKILCLLVLKYLTLVDLCLISGTYLSAVTNLLTFGREVPILSCLSEVSPRKHSFRNFPSVDSLDPFKQRFTVVFNEASGYNWLLIK